MRIARFSTSLCEKKEQRSVALAVMCAQLSAHCFLLTQFFDRSHQCILTSGELFLILLKS